MADLGEDLQGRLQGRLQERLQGLQGLQDQEAVEAGRQMPRVPPRDQARLGDQTRLENQEAKVPRPKNFPTSWI